MTPQQIVGIGLRLLAVWIAIRYIGIFFLNASAFRSLDMNDKVISTLFLTIGWIGVAGFLWFFPMWVADRLIPRTRFENKINIQPLEVARVGCCLIGLWLFANDLGTFIWLLFKGALTPGNSSVIRSFSPDEQLQFLVVTVQIAFALLLMFGSAQFAILVQRGTRVREIENPDVKSH